MSCQQTLFVGDAHGIEPAFAGGIHFALSYGEIAAQQIIDAFDHNDFSFSSYKNRFYSHYSGKFMNHCISIAKKLYSQQIDPFTAAHQVFTIKKI
jgi:flavin-dependent dehydrogenase